MKYCHKNKIIGIQFITETRVNQSSYRQFSTKTLQPKLDCLTNSQKPKNQRERKPIRTSNFSKIGSEAYKSLKIPKLISRHWHNSMNKYAIRTKSDRKTSDREMGWISLTRLKGLSQEGDLGEESSSRVTSLPPAKEREKREKKRMKRRKLWEWTAIVAR